MEKDFPHFDALIYNQTQTYLDSEVPNRTQNTPHHPVDVNSSDTSFDGFRSCMDQVILWAERAMKAYQELESTLQNSTSSKDFLLQEIQLRDQLIKHLEEEIKEEEARRSKQLHQLQCERYLMEKLLKDYSKQLRDTNKKFEDYRARVMNNLNSSDNEVGR